MVDYYKHKMSGSEEEPESHTQPGMTKAELRRVKISLNHHYFGCCGIMGKELNNGRFRFLIRISVMKSLFFDILSGKQYLWRLI